MNETEMESDHYILIEESIKYEESIFARKDGKIISDPGEIEINIKTNEKKKSWLIRNK